MSCVRSPLKWRGCWPPFGSAGRTRTCNQWISSPRRQACDLGFHGEPWRLFHSCCTGLRLQPAIRRRRHRADRGDPPGRNPHPDMRAAADPGSRRGSKTHITESRHRSGSPRTEPHPLWNSKSVRWTVPHVDSRPSKVLSWARHFDSPEMADDRTVLWWWSWIRRPDLGRTKHSLKEAQ